LKSKKHHIKIIAARNKGPNPNTSESTNAADKQTQIINKPLFKAKNKRKLQAYKRNKPIKFVSATNQFASMNISGNQLMNASTDTNMPDLSNYGNGIVGYPNQNILMPNYSYVTLPTNQNQPTTNN